MNAKKKILIVFPDTHLSYSPSTLNLYDSLSETFEVTIITFIPDSSYSTHKILNRNIPTSIKRKVWQRDQGQCQYIDPQTNKKCGSKHQLEYDHLRPWSLMGEHTSKNLHLCCRVHNQYRWKRLAEKLT